MRGRTSLIATALASALLTAIVMQAAAGAGAGAEPSLQATGERPTTMLGLGKSFGACNPNPKNAQAWTKFSKCVTRNFASVKRWTRRMDQCLVPLKIAERNDLAIYVGGGDPGTDVAPGGQALVHAGDGQPFEYFMGWRTIQACRLR